MEKDIFEITELEKTEEPQESEAVELDFNLEIRETWETVEPNIRVKKVDGKVARYEVKLDLKNWNRKCMKTHKARILGICVLSLPKRGKWWVYRIY